MASLLPVNFPEPPDLAIASYDYVDVAEGVGYVIFNGMTNQNLSGSLTRSTLYSATTTTIGTRSSTTSGSVFNENYDAKFQLPRIVASGSAFLNVVQGFNVTAQNGNVYIVSTLQKSSGSVVTTIGTAQSRTLTSGSDFSRIEMIEIPTQRTNLKAGDILRLNVDVWGYSSPSAESQTYGFGHDPQNRDDDGTTRVILAADPTTLTLHVPFDLKWQT